MANRNPVRNFTPEQLRENGAKGGRIRWETERAIRGDILVMLVDDDSSALIRAAAAEIAALRQERKALVRAVEALEWERKMRGAQ